MADNHSGSLTPRLPVVNEKSPIKQLHTQLSLTRTKNLPCAKTQRKAESSPKEQKVINHFLIRYLEQTQKTVVWQDKRTETSISPHFRRAMIRIRHTPRKPLQTRFLIANHESISFA